MMSRNQEFLIFQRTPGFYFPERPTFGQLFSGLIILIIHTVIRKSLGLLSSNHTEQQQERKPTNRVWKPTRISELQQRIFGTKNPSCRLSPQLGFILRLVIVILVAQILIFKPNLEEGFTPSTVNLFQFIDVQFLHFLGIHYRYLSFCHIGFRFSAAPVSVLAHICTEQPKKVSAKKGFVHKLFIFLLRSLH